MNRSLATTGIIGARRQIISPASGDHQSNHLDGPFECFHVNSVAIDNDGNLIVPARNTWTIYKIDRRTGGGLGIGVAERGTLPRLCHSNRTNPVWE